MVRINIHARNRAPRFFFNGINLTVVEHDIAILQIKNKEKFKCVEKLIWPACLPSKVSILRGNYSDNNFVNFLRRRT